MHKNILIVTDNFTRGGLENFIINRISALKQNYNFVFAITNYQSRPALKDYKIIKLKTSLSATTADVLSDVKTIEKIIQQEKIDLIEVHPFYSFAPTMLAANICGIPCTYFVHGPASVANDQRFNAKFLQRFFMTHFCRHIFSVKPQLINALKTSYHVENAHFLPNTIDTTAHKQVTPAKNHHYALFSRLDPDKISSIILALQSCRGGGAHLDIYGDGSARTELQNYIAKNRLSKFAKIHPWVNQWTDLLPNYQAVFGVGRVVIEALASGFPVVLVGNDKLGPAITPDNYSHYQYYNFTNSANRSLSPAEFSEELKKLDKIKPSELKTLRSYVIRNHDNSVHKKLQSELSFTPEHFPQLDAFYQAVKNFPENVKQEPFFDSFSIDDHLRGAFQSFYDPLLTDLISIRTNEREINLLKSQVAAYKIQIDALSADSHQSLSKRIKNRLKH